jgi:hypothetical protein
MANSLVSPNAIMDAAVEMMLDGREPEDREEQLKLLQFACFNVASGFEGAVGRLMLSIFPERLGLLTEDDVAMVVVQRNCDHPADQLKCSYAGAPGTGRRVWCDKCGMELENTIRVLEPWETI